MKPKVKLTQFSHGAGCGCKISPAVLDIILKNNSTVSTDYNNLLVGNNSRDDAAVYDLGNGTALISTTDFFLPIVDDPFDFGRIASANAISDVYAMGGTPILAIAILGWPVDKIAPELAADVVAGAKAICAEAGISLAGGHSIDSPEPIFGLAVNGTINLENLKRNNTAREGDLLFLSKPLGIGILSTASKKGLLSDADKKIAVEQMCTLNKIGIELGKIKGLHALTDVTGFGLLGHLCEMADGSGLSAEISFNNIPFLDNLDYYISHKCIPGGTVRNYKSFGHKISFSSASDEESQINFLCDPQTSGGLLVAAAENAVDDFLKIAEQFGLGKILSEPIGKIVSKKEKVVFVL